MNAQEQELEIASHELAHELAGEQMDPIEIAKSIKDAWSHLPKDLQDQIKAQGKLHWQLRGFYLARFMATVNAIFGRNPQAWTRALTSNRSGAIQQIALQAGREARIPARGAAGRPGFSDAQVRAHHQRQYQRGRVPGRNNANRRWREFELELSGALPELESGEGFWTKVSPLGFGPGSQEGHEILTRRALASFSLPAAEQNAIVSGVIRPDRGGNSYWNFPGAALGSFRAANQASHSLRATSSTTTPAALSAIRNRFAQLYGRVLSAPARIQALEWLGEAIHLLQDSFSNAHVERAGPAGPIRLIRAFYVQVGWPPVSRAPGEHNVPSDDRDNIYSSGTSLRPEAAAAINATIALIAMALRHLAAPSAPNVNPELRAFMDRYLSM